jgi:starch synthase (maltosyl-transferring)
METGIRDSGFGIRDSGFGIRSDAAPAGADVHPDLRTRQRVIVERVWPEIDGGRFPIKRTVGEPVTVSADIFADGHDLLAGVVRYRHVPAGRPAPGDRDGSLSAGRPAPGDRDGSFSAGRPAPGDRDGSLSAGRPSPGDRRSAEPAPRTSNDSRPGPVAQQDPRATDPAWQEVALVSRDNDRWEGTFTVSELGDYEYTIEAWIDRFGSWLKGLVAKADAGQDVSSELLEGAEIIQAAAVAGRPAGMAGPPSRGNSRSAGPALRTSIDSRPGPVAQQDPRATDPAEGLRLLEIADLLRSDAPQVARVWTAKDPSLRALMDARPDRGASTCYARTLVCRVDSVRARFGAWYEMFPRSVTPDASRSGTFRDAESRLADIAAMGFDVVYLPPVHPIGITHRKGRNNVLTAAPGDPGSPWAIGSTAGGHTAIEPGLGTIDDFDRFVRLADRLGMEVALDIAFQTSPDHPWVREHPAWFRHRPDGSIKYAENPPKKYQDIYPIDFESAEWESLWNALRDVFLFWIDHGVRTFRVDNPHTKSFRFWEWVIAEIRRDHPDAIFLAEAFTRPTVMRYLAKCGFNQSYTYFTWRNSAQELREYLTELTRSELQEYMRPNFFANTPDILHEYLQTGGRPAFEVRLILAATLAANYGIYSGFELCENVPVRKGSEEYLDSEKYQIKPRDWSQADSLRELIARVNTIRRDYPALQQNATLSFYQTDNPHFLWFSKSERSERPERPERPERSERSERSERVFVVVNTDPHWTQQGWVQVPIWEMGIDARQRYVVEDLLDGARYTWRGEWNFVKLDPTERVAHLFVVRDSGLGVRDSI